MDDDRACPLPTQAERDYYKLYRDRVTVEDQLVYYRMSWLLVSQTIMFSIWASAFVREKGQSSPPFGTLTMAVLGVMICGVVYPGIWAALAAIDRLKEEYDRKQRALNGSDQARERRLALLPDLVSGGRVSFWGRIGPFVLPPLFAVAWVAVAAHALL